MCSTSIYKSRRFGVNQSSLHQSMFPAPWQLWGYWKAEEWGTENRNVSDRNHFNSVYLELQFSWGGRMALKSGLGVGSNCSSGWSGLSKQGHPARPFTSRVLFSPNSMHSPAEEAKINSRNNNSSNRLPCVPLCFHRHSKELDSNTHQNP